MTNSHVLNEKLSSFEYYEQKLPLYLRNSYGFIEHFRIWYDLLVQTTPFTFNQLINNGNFETTSGWAQSGSTFTVSDNVCHIKSNSNLDTSRIQKQTTPRFRAGHKYYYTLYIVPPKNNQLLINTARLTSGTITLRARTLVAETPLLIEYIYSATDDSQGFRIYYNRNANLTANDVTDISNVMVIDLTEIFGAGNEPETVEEFKAIYPNDYYDYNTGTYWIDSISSTIDFLFELLNIFDVDCEQSHLSGFEANEHYLSMLNMMEDTNDGNSSDILDKIGNLFGLKRAFSVDVGGTEYMLNLNNKDFLTLIKCTIIRNYFDGSFAELNQYYKDAGLPVFILTNASNPAQCDVHLIDIEGSNYEISTNVKRMFLAGLLMVESVGISYTYSIHGIQSTAIFDSNDVSKVFDAGVFVI